MPRFSIEVATALKHLRIDTNGVVSFEYVILAFCIIAIVGAAFDAGTSSLIGTTLTNAIAAVCAALATAVGS